MNAVVETVPKVTALSWSFTAAGRFCGRQTAAHSSFERFHADNAKRPNAPPVASPATPTPLATHPATRRPLPWLAIAGSGREGADSASKAFACIDAGGEGGPPGCPASSLRPADPARAPPPPPPRPL